MKFSKKSLILIIISIGITLFTGCTNDAEYKKKEFFKVAYQSSSLVYNKTIELFPEDIRVLTSVEELDTLELENYDYSNAFFLTKSIVAINFKHPSTEQNIILKDVVNSDGKLYCIFELDSQETHTDDILYSLYFIEVSNDSIKNYSVGEILVINSTLPELGSVHYNKFDGIIS